MIEVDGNQYRLGLVDTNVLSEVLKNPRREGRAFLEWCVGSHTFPAVSVWSVLELRKRPQIYDSFLETFSAYPFVLLRTPLHLFLEELRAYSDRSKVHPVQFVFSPLNVDPAANLRTFITTLFSREEVQQSEAAWKHAWRKESLDALLGLKSNFKPAGHRYDAEDAARFVRLGVPQYVVALAAALAGRTMQGEIDPDAFPSAKMGFYTTFYRFYAERRQPQLQDTFDILITGATPYMSTVHTENFQAEILRKVQRRDPFIQHVGIFTLKDLRL
jgi:hypothetical protein